MNASNLSKAQIAFLLKQAEDGTAKRGMSQGRNLGEPRARGNG